MIYFTTGIDTNIGKTYATGVLAREMMQGNKRVITQKLIQTGCREISEDILKHRELMGIDLLQEDYKGITCPYVLEYPCSPHLAAQYQNEVIDIDRIDFCTEQLQQAYHYEEIIIEGAGGLFVPLSEAYTTFDFVKDRGYPLVLVSSGRLGSINHTLLNLELCRLHHISIAYLVFNKYPKADPFIEKDTEKIIKKYLSNYFPDTIFFVLEEQFY